MTGTLDCPVKRNAKGHLECPDCHWVYKGKAEHPRRNCPNSPDINTPEHRERIRTRLLAELQKLVDEDRIPNSIPKIATQLDLCLAPCKEFNGQVCNRRGEGCTRSKRWREFLALSDRPCEYFEASPSP